MMLSRMVAGLGLMGLLASCGVQPCVTAIDPKLLPPPISAAEQAKLLADWSQAMPLLRATSVPLGVRIEYKDEKGEKKQQNAEGTLAIRQRFEQGETADVLLLGKAFDQPVFEAGRNATNWWFLIRLETKTAWVGDSTRPREWSSGNSGGGSSILRADLVPELLGISALGTVPTSIDGAIRYLRPRTVTTPPMIVDDATGTNRLLEMAGTATHPYISRELIIDRLSGELREVRLYNADGKVMVSSVLTDYKPVTYPEGTQAPARPQKFPHLVTVSYPAQNMKIVLQFDEVTVPARIPEAAFRMNTEGLKVANVE